MEPVYLLGILVATLKSYSLSALFAFGILFFVSFHINNVLLYYAGGILFLAPLLPPLLAKWMPKKRVPIDGKAVFISGCDSGFGFMLAQRLDEVGFQVFAGCLFPEGPGAERLQKSGSKRLHVLGLDVTSDASIEKAVAYVNENIGDNLLWGVVSNAGICEPGELPLVSMETIQRTFDVNTFGVVRLTKAFLQMLRKSEGRVVVVASIAGRVTFPSIVPYSMSKRAVIGFCDGLRLEMYKWNIQVISIEPILNRTPLADLQRISQTMSKMWESVPNDVKETYSSKHIENRTEIVRSILNFFARDPIEVVAVMEEALTNLHPQYYYQPGSSILQLFFWIAKRVPKPVFDLICFYILEKEHSK